MERYLTLLLFWLAAGAAHADMRVAVHDFYGPRGELLRGDVVELLVKQHGLTVVPARQLDLVARQLDVDAFSPDGRKAIARELGLSAWLTGVVDVFPRRARLRVMIYDGAEHVRMGGATLEARRVTELRGLIKRTFWLKTKTAILEAMPPLPSGRAPIEEIAKQEPRARRKRRGAPAPEPQQEPASVAALESRSWGTATDAAYMKPRTSRTTHAAYMEPAQSLSLVQAETSRRDGGASNTKQKASISDGLRLAIGVGTPVRSLRYSDPLSDGLNDYQLGSSVMFEANAVWYPAQQFSESWPRYFGVDFAAQGAVPSSSQDSFGNSYRSTYDAYRLGLRARYPFGRHFVHAFSGYSIARGTVTGDEGAVARTPSVDYRAWRSGLGSELALSEDVAVGFDAAWLSLLSAGEIARWFPHTSANGLELAMHATYALGERWFARLGASYRRIAFDFRARPGDERVAGGATDQTLTVSAGAGVSL